METGILGELDVGEKLKMRHYAVLGKYSGNPMGLPEASALGRSEVVVLC